MELVLLSAALGVALNIAASIAVFRIPGALLSQRLLQLALIWLLPILGAVLCWAFAASQAAAAAAPERMEPLYLPSDGGPADMPVNAAGSGCIGGEGDGGGAD